MRKSILIILLSCVATIISAQSKLSSAITTMMQSVEAQVSEGASLISKGDAVCPVDTASIQQRMAVRFHADGTVKSLDVIAHLAQGAVCPSAELEAQGIKVTGEALGFVFLDVPAEKLSYLETVDAFVSLYENGVCQPLNDVSRSCVLVSDINGMDKDLPSDLTMGYTGKGIVVGIIDSGIDYNHRAFKNADGTTRVVKAVDYSNGSKQVCTTPEEIAKLKSDLYNVTSDDDLSHGTHVAGTAAGSPVEASQKDGTIRNVMGMAPEADLVLCGLKILYDNRAIECIKEIKKTADAQGKPFVINMSFGHDVGWHNAQDAISIAIRTVMEEIGQQTGEEGSGFIPCSATGNEGGYTSSVDYTMETPGDQMTIILNKNASNMIPVGNFFFYTNSESTACFTYEYKVVNVKTGQVMTLAEQPLLNSSKSKVAAPSISMSKPSDGNGRVLGTMKIDGERCFSDNDCYLAVVLTSKESNLRVYVQSSNMKSNTLYATDVPSFNYVKGSADMSVNVLPSSDDVISVGAYTNTRTFYSYLSNKKYNFAETQTGPDGGAARFSSYGVDDNGTPRPDVIAPGTAVVSGTSQYDTDALTADGEIKTDAKFAVQCTAYVMDNDGRKNWYSTNNGTSMATPMVAGIMALWLQADPNMTPYLARMVLKETSRKQMNGNDVTVPSGNPVQMGAGVIDAAAGLRFILNGYEPTDVKAIVDKQREKKVEKYLAPDGRIILVKGSTRYNAAGTTLAQ